MNSKHLIVLITAFLLAPFGATQSYETDQYSTELLSIEDSTIQFDDIVNQVLAQVAQNWRGPRDDSRFVKKIFKAFSSREFERWASHSPLAKNAGVLSTSIYRDVGWFNSAPIRFKGIAPTISLAGVHLGTDKLSHFFGVGRNYYQVGEIDNADLPEQERVKEAIEEGFSGEKGIWGELTTNIFSNADIIANFEGYQFYRSIFEAGIIAGKGPLVGWSGDRPVIKRKFSFRDHVTPLWNEALFPNSYQDSIKKKVINRLYELCEQESVRNNIEKFELGNEAELLVRYKGLQSSLKLAPQFKLKNICSQWDQKIKSEKEKLRAKQKKMAQKSLSHNRFHSELSPMNERELELEELIYDWIPGCRKQVETGNEAYGQMMEWKNNVFRFYNMFAKSQLNNILKYHNRIDENVAFMSLLTLSNGFKNMKIDEEESEWLQGSWYVEFPIEFEKRVSDIRFEFSQYNETQGRACIKTLVPYSSEIDKRTYTQLKACYQIESQIGVVDENISYYVSNKYRSRFSINNYYDFNDRNGFIYRMISDFCKWY